MQIFCFTEDISTNWDNKLYGAKHGNDPYPLLNAGKVP